MFVQIILRNLSTVIMWTMAKKIVVDYMGHTNRNNEDNVPTCNTVSIVMLRQESILKCLDQKAHLYCNVN